MKKINNERRKIMRSNKKNFRDVHSCDHGQFEGAMNSAVIKEVTVFVKHVELNTFSSNSKALVKY